MINNICIYEDETYKNLLPLVYLQPVYDLKCGILSIREKIENYFAGSKLILHSRKTLQNLLRKNNPDINVNSFKDDKILFINGRLLPEEKIIEKLKSIKSDIIFQNKDTVVAAFLSGNNLKNFAENQSDLMDGFTALDIEKVNVDAELFRYPWDLISANNEEIKKDFKLLVNKNEEPKNYIGVHFIKCKDIFIGNEVIIKPNVVIDAEDGPVYIDDNVKILPNVYIQGPAYIGKNSLVRSSAQIYEGTSIGQVCKVGGEIENSVIHSYSNKQHEGFLGNSYLGSWVNIAAGSNTSDLKNNYGNIRVRIHSQEVDTGLQFVGLIMGDHSKCGINTMFNTGTVVGVSCNIYGGDFPPKYIPSFSWGGSNGFVEYDLRKAVEVAKTVKARRNVSMSVNDLELFKSVFESTKNERKDFLSK